MVITIASFGRGTAFGSFILLSGAIQDPMTSKSSVFPVGSSISEQLRGRDFPGKDRPVILPHIGKSEISNTRAIPADTMDHYNISLHRKASPSLIPETIVDQASTVFSWAMPDSCHVGKLSKPAKPSAQLLAVKNATKTLRLAREAYRQMTKYHINNMPYPDRKGESYTKKEITRQMEVVNECRSNLLKLENPDIAAVTELPARLTKKEVKSILDRYKEQHSKSIPHSTLDVVQPTRKRAQPPSAIVVPVKPNPEATNLASTAERKSQAPAKNRRKKKASAEAQTSGAKEFKKVHPEISNVPPKLSLGAKKKLLAAAAAADTQDVENKTQPRRASQRIANRVMSGSNFTPTDLSKRGSTAHDPITID